MGLARVAPGDQPVDELLQAIVGSAELAAAAPLLANPEPILTKVGGGLLAVHGFDNFRVGARKFLFGEEAETATKYALRKTLETVAPPEVADSLAEGVDSALSGVAIAKASAAAATQAARAIEAEILAGAEARTATAEAEGIVYKRVDPKAGDAYVGQAKSPERYVARQGEHNAKLGVKHDYEIKGRATPGTDLDVLEKSLIRQEGGLQREGGTLVNRRHQMNERKYRAAGGTVDDPNH